MDPEKIRRVKEKQRYFQSTRGLTHMRMPYDRIVAGVIPGLMVVFTGFYTVKGFIDLVQGNKKE